ncbi:MAG TPA: PH domain-containing protein [Thermoleophilaceae bacterium]|nr:PH domain-containing protein [Thermoleophilaceae bacterium]
MDLAAGERELFSGHPSWRSTLTFYIKGLVVAAVAAGIGYLVGDEGTAALVGVAILAVAVVVGFVRRLSTTYTITTQRLHIRRGLISRRTQEARLERVQNVNTSQSALERILQVGSVDFDTAGTTDSDFTFAGVSQPEKVVRAVDEAQREHAAEPRLETDGV